MIGTQFAGHRFLRLVAFVELVQGWMNPGEYPIANPVKGSPHVPYRGKYFDVYSSNISLHYAEVYWKYQPGVDLPEEFVARYKDKVVAFTGYEVNSVRINATGGEEAIPLYEQYNHHFDAYILGAAAEMVYTGAVAEHHAKAHGCHGRSKWHPRDVSGNTQSIPSVWMCDDAGGGEYRGTLNAVGVGYAFLVGSPDKFSLEPMMINTKNPNGKGPGGPLPRESRAPPNASYSGLLECPCTDRKKKVMTEHITKDSGLCTNAVDSAGTCFRAAATMGLTSTLNTTLDSAEAPRGCFVVATVKGYEVKFNNASSSNVSCGSSHSPGRAVGSRATEQIDLHVDLVGATGNLTITMTGPSTKWFGAGLGSGGMTGTYAIIVDGHGSITERQLGEHTPGDMLPPQVHVLENTVQDGVRTVTMTRRLAGASSRYYSFKMSTPSFPFISAVGTGPDFGYHHSRSGAEMYLIEVGPPVCICNGGKSGTIDGVPFSKVCQPQPISDLLAQDNPVCTIETYGGGLACCSHGTILLDQDQAVPPAIDTYRMKFRFYYEDYDTQHQAFVMYWTQEMSTEEYEIPQCLPGDSPKTCEHKGIKDNVHTTSTTFLVRNSTAPCAKGATANGYCAPGWNESSKVLLLRAGAHCHAPACIMEELWNLDTNELLCRTGPRYGTGLDPMDEASYAVAIPPCLWGDAADGLSPPPRLSLDTRLRSIKHANATYHHYGVMHQWYMHGAWEY